MIGSRLAPHRRGRATRRSLLAALASLAVVAAGLVAGGRVGGLASAATTAGSPSGHVDSIAGVSGGLRFVGWAADPNSAGPLTVYVTADGRRIGGFAADGSRPDVTKVFPSIGPNHGFASSLTLSEGSHAVCVYAQNVGAGADTQLTCRNVTLDFGPRGHVDVLATEPGKVHVRGWAYDYDTPSPPINVAISIDSSTQYVLADQSRPDVGKAFPFAGSAHGFDVTEAMAQGTHKVCVTGVNTGYGTDNVLGCATLTLADSPRGHLDTVAQQAGKLVIAGWGYDPDAATSPVNTTITVDGTAHTVLANGSRPDVGAAFPVAGPNHGFNVSYSLPQGTHNVCVTVRNVSYGSDLAFPCRSAVVNFTPTAALNTPAQGGLGVKLTGWATDPDTSSPINVQLTGNGHTTTVLANQTGSTHSGHNFSAVVPLTSGNHTLCAVGVNVLNGTSNSPASCHAVNFAYAPYGHFDSAARSGTSSNLTVTGWASDPDTTGSVAIVITVDGAAHTVTANVSRPDVPHAYPGLVGTNSGFAATLSANSSEHRVCVTAKNVGGGADRSLGCKVVNALHPTVPSAPQNVSAHPSYTSATVTWSAPASDGGAPWSKYTVTASGGPSVSVGAATTSATIGGLHSGTTYTFSVRATNVAGTSAAGVSAAVKTLVGPPPQTTPAPVSTSRYIRNISSGSTTELSTMRAEGLADARANPANHRYLILLDIGGQDDVDGGAVLSATTRFVTYGTLVKDIEAYIDGYHGGQQLNAPLWLAVGTNNDMNVSSTSGRSWADKVVDPLVSYAHKYSGITIAGANDMEPGFRATYSATASWLSGYLSATSAPFVFNGSADGCSWTATNRGCNNGWTMAGLYNLAAGAASTRIVNLPQIYNTAMAGQWKYISLTGVGAGKPRVNFGGPLTEWTACDQTNSCGSLTGHTAWSTLWSNLQSDTRLKISSLPYSTDLRIDR